MLGTSRGLMVGVGFVVVAAAWGGCTAEPEDEQYARATEEGEAGEYSAPSDAESEPADAVYPGDIPPAVGESEPSGEGAPAPQSDRETDRLRPAVTAFSGATGRGRYLTEQVAMCVQCHSPKDERGRVIEERKFEGSPIPVASPYPPREWAVEAPSLIGMNRYTREEAVRLLTEGISRDGDPPDPPMPPFRMTQEDAVAVHEYLSGLEDEP